MNMTTLTPLPVRVITSTRRRKTVSARVVDGEIEVRVPAGLPPLVQTEYVDGLVAKLERGRETKAIDLVARSHRLAAQHDLPMPTSIDWSSRQNKRWGSCAPASGNILISHRLSQMPSWVLDFVIVHELAHLVEYYHNRRFYELVARYPRAERADGFLDAVSLGHAGELDGFAANTCSPSDHVQ